MFERTLGSSTRRIVAIRVLPSANAASRMCAGTACSPSRVAANSGGSAISDIIAPAGDERAPEHAAAFGGERERREQADSWKTARPKSAITMSGVPATISIVDSTTRASHVGRPYSAIQTALASASGNASTMPITVSSAGADQRVEKASFEPLCDRCSLRARDDQVGPQVLDAAVAHVDHDRRGDHAQRHACRPRRATSARRSPQRQRHRRGAPRRAPPSHRRHPSAGVGWPPLPPNGIAAADDAALIRASGTCAAAA